MATTMAQPVAILDTPSSRHDVVSELLDDYTYGDSDYEEDAAPKSSLAPAFKELPPPPPRTDSLRDPKTEAIQRMNTKFQLREDDELSVSSNGSRSGGIDQTPRTRITSRSLSRSGTPPSLKLYVSNGATAHIPPTPLVYAPVKTLPSSIITDSKDLPPPPPPERSIKRKEIQAPGMGHAPSKSELERNDSFHSQSEGRSPAMSQSETAAVVPPVKRKAIPGAGVKKFVSLLELNNGPRGGKPAAPTSAPRKMSADKGSVIVPKSNATSSMLPAEEEITTRNQLPPTPPEEKSVPSPPRKALVGVGLPSNPRTKQPMSPLHTRGKSSTGFNILKAQRPAPPIPTLRKEVTTPEMTPSPTLKPETPADNEISPMKPLPPPTEHHRPFSYEGPGEKQQVQPVQQKAEQKEPEQVEETKVEQQKDDETKQVAPSSVTPANPTPTSQPTLPVRTTSLDPPEPSPSVRPWTAPAPQSTFVTTHPSLSMHNPAPPVSEEPASPDTLNATSIGDEQPFTPLTQQSIPLRVNLIPRITHSQLHCYTQHRTNVWSNNVFQPMGCMICHANEKDRKFSCTWCQLRICRGCSEELKMVPGRDLGKLLEARRSRECAKQDAVSMTAVGPRVLVEDVDQLADDDDDVGGEDNAAALESDSADSTVTERGRSMTKVDSRERTALGTLRD